MDRGDLATGIVFSVANPFGLAFWTGVGGGMATVGGAAPALYDGSVFLAGFAFGALVWCLGAAGTIGWGRRFVRAGLFRWISALSGLALDYFGLRLLWETATSVLERTTTAIIEEVTPPAAPVAGAGGNAR